MPGEGRFRKDAGQALGGFGQVKTVFFIFLIYFSVFNSKLISAFYEKLDLKKVKSLAFKSSNLVFSALIIIVYNNLFMIYSKNIIGNDYLVGEFALLQKFTEIPISIC